MTPLRSTVIRVGVLDPPPARVGYAQANNQVHDSRSCLLYPESFSPTLHKAFRLFLLLLFLWCAAFPRAQQNPTTRLDAMTKSRKRRSTNSFDPPTDTPANRATNCGCNRSRGFISQVIWFDPAQNRTHGRPHKTNFNKSEWPRKLNISTYRRVKCIHHYADKAQFLGARPQ